MDAVSEFLKLCMCVCVCMCTTCSRDESPVEHERGARCMKNKLRYVMVADTNHITDKRTSYNCDIL